MRHAEIAPLSDTHTIRYSFKSQGKGELTRSVSTLYLGQVRLVPPHQGPQVRGNLEGLLPPSSLQEHSVSYILYIHFEFVCFVADFSSCVVLCSETAAALQGLTLVKAIKFLQDVQTHTACVPFRRHNGSVGRTAQAKVHGVVQGRWPVK